MRQGLLRDTRAGQEKGADLGDTSVYSGEKKVQAVGSPVGLNY